MPTLDEDRAIRLAAFRWLQTVTSEQGTVPRRILQEGFRWQGQRVPVIGPKGIFKPAVMALPLSVTTLPDGPYDDSFDDAGLLQYRYRGTDPEHPDNRGLRACMEHRVPLVHFLRVVPGAYLATWPVYVVEDLPSRLTFRIELEAATTGLARDAHIEVRETEKRYATVELRRRLHQATFRERVLSAYRERCAVCALRHRELLDAAHIIPDTEEHGTPEVRNGLALCRLHHAAFDRMFLAIRPDYVVEVRRDILEEEDGPMLVHGLQAMHGRRIILPSRRSHRPDRRRLEERYRRFLEEWPAR
ncbi:MAG TPA: HNH endonuclease [Chromatiales bacterium]|nr:HNH endonuclease [Chromatiales bacterium]